MWVRACGLCGTDLHLARDWRPDYAPIGHEISAEVIENSEGDIPCQRGDKVIVEDVAQCGTCEDCKNRYDLDSNVVVMEPDRSV